MPMQEPELLNSISLGYEMGDKVVKGELVRIQSFKRHDFEGTTVTENSQTALVSIELGQHV